MKEVDRLIAVVAAVDEFLMILSTKQCTCIECKKVK